MPSSGAEPSAPDAAPVMVLPQDDSCDERPSVKNDTDAGIDVDDDVAVDELADAAAAAPSVDAAQMRSVRRNMSLEGDRHNTSSEAKLNM